MTLEQQLLKYKYSDDMGNIINYTGFINYLVNEGAKLEHKLQSYSTEEGGIKDSSMRYNVDSIFNQLELNILILVLKEQTIQELLLIIN